MMRTYKLDRVELWMAPAMLQAAGGLGALRCFVQGEPEHIPMSVHRRDDGQIDLSITVMMSKCAIPHPLHSPELRAEVLEEVKRVLRNRDAIQ